MTVDTIPMQQWLEQDQEAWVHSLGRIRLRLGEKLDVNQGSPEMTSKKASKKTSEPKQSNQANGLDTPNLNQQQGSGDEEPETLERLAKVFGLSTFEKDLLILCAGVEWDTEIANLVKMLQGASASTLPTFGLAFGVLDAPHWSAVNPAAPLRQWRMIELGAGERLTDRPLQIDERVLQYLAGLSYIDTRFQGYIELVTQEMDLPESYQRVAEQIEAHWSEASSQNRGVIQLINRQGNDVQAIALQACQQLGINLHRLRVEDIPTNATERVALARLWEREAVLSHTALLIEQNEGQDLLGARRFLEQARSLTLLAVKEPLIALQRMSHRVEVPSLTQADQLAVWKAGLGTSAAGLNGHLGEVVSQFQMGPAGIREVCDDLLIQDAQEAEQEREETLTQSLWSACRTQARRHLDGLAERIDSNATWEDLVLPEAQLQTLRDIGNQVKHRQKVYEDWGFTRKSARGLGISALFTGSSGVGKTLASEVLANELSLDLYKIDLSQVVSKYIGETEKNLRRVFDAAEQSGAILFFDEADALFGKRTEVKDSHDRYANIECSYLLQRMESYPGLAVLTTNMKQGLDQAFLRRIRFIVHFSFPGHEHRKKIWQRVFPNETPTNNLNLNKLSQLNMTGGNIRNIALHAAFFAAEAKESVTMAHLLQATRAEYAKLEKSLPEKEIRNWLEK